LFDPESSVNWKLPERPIGFEKSINQQHSAPFLKFWPLIIGIHHIMEIVMKGREYMLWQEKQGRVSGEKMNSWFFHEAARYTLCIV